MNESLWIIVLGAIVVPMIGVIFFAILLHSRTKKRFLFLCRQNEIQLNEKNDWKPSYMGKLILYSQTHDLESAVTWSPIDEQVPKIESKALYMKQHGRWQTYQIRQFERQVNGLCWKISIWSYDDGEPVYGILACLLLSEYCIRLNATALQEEWPTVEKLYDTLLDAFVSVQE